MFFFFNGSEYSDLFLPAAASLRWAALFAVFLVGLYFGVSARLVSLFLAFSGRCRLCIYTYILFKRLYIFYVFSFFRLKNWAEECRGCVKALFNCSVLCSVLPFARKIVS